MHNGFLSIDSKKMSKSLGNFFTVREAAEAYGYASIRMFMLMSHYRSPINYSGEILISAGNALERLRTAKNNLVFLTSSGSDTIKTDETELIESLPRFRERFIEALDDDFNTADAVSVIFELVRECNTVSAGEGVSKGFAVAALEVFDEIADVLGLFYGDSEGAGGGSSADAEVEALIEARRAARSEKNWAEADRIRDRLTEMGVVIEDTPQGTRRVPQKDGAS